MIFASSARWPHTWFGARTEASNTRVAQQRRTPFLSDMSDSGKASSDRYGQLMARLDASRLKRDEPLAQYTTFRIGGPADVFYDATSTDDLAGAVSAARDTGIEYFVLGLGANILIGDRGFRGLVIRNTSHHLKFFDDGRLWVESGAVMAKLIPLAVEQGLSGLEHYVGIPSTVGGAVWQNLHFLSPAPARERTMFIAEVFESAELLSHDGERKTVDRDYMNFGYDTSTLHKQRDVALAVTFKLERGDEAVMHRVMQENLSWRGGKHPWLEYHPSAGSIFKKIEGVGAGRLIDQVGLKGFRHGDAQISHIHAHIMVNLGKAAGRDVPERVGIARANVQKQFGQRLEPEIGFVGEF